MAKKQEKKKPVLERTYNVPLRREFMKAPKWKRTPKAARALRQFIVKHMKPGLDEKGKLNVKIGKYANEKLWEHGMKNPPHHIKVDAVKDDAGLVKVELVGAPKEEPKVEEKKPVKKKEAPKELSNESEKLPKEGLQKSKTFEKGLEKSKTSQKVKEEEVGKLEEAVEEAKETKQEKVKEIEKEEIKEIKKEKPAHAPKEPAKEKVVEQHQTGPMHR